MAAQRRISKPSRTKFWVVRNADGERVHVGETEPGQVTDTGLAEIEAFDTEGERDLAPRRRGQRFSDGTLFTDGFGFTET